MVHASRLRRVGLLLPGPGPYRRNLEDPFENRVYDVPLTTITKTIEINLLQILGDRELPLPEQPNGGVLWYDVTRWNSPIC